MSRQPSLKRVLASAAVVVLVAGGCGSRVTKAQIEAARQTGLGGAGSPALGTDGGTGAGVVAGGGVTTTTAPGGVIASGPGSGSGTGGAGSTPVATSQVAGAPGSATANTVASEGPATAAASTGVSVSSQVCRSAASGPGVSPTEIDVGNVSTLTGPVPGLFLGAQHGITAFAAYVNSIGGICGRKLVVKSADDDLDVSQNATATQSLAGSVFAFVGSFSGDDQGGAAVLQSDGVPDVGEALSTQRFDLSNNFSPEPKPLGWNVAPYIYFKQKYPNAATHMANLAANQATGQAEAKAQQAALESIGYKFVYTDLNIEPTQTDYSADAQAMKAKGAQGVVFSATAPFYADVAKALQNAGVTLALPNYANTAYDPAYIADAGSAANGTVIQQAEAMYEGEDAAAVPMVALFDKWYNALYHSPPDEFAMYSWLSGLLFIDGLNAGGALTRQALLAGLGQTHNFNAGGMMALGDPAGKKPPGCYLIIDVVNGKFVRDPVDPAAGFDCANAPDYYYYKG